MSTKTTIFLTEDDDHVYSDCSEPITKNGKYIGDAIILELSSKHTELINYNDDHLTIRLNNPESELYKKFYNKEI